MPVFDAAVNDKLNLWDTATAYGMGASKDILAGFVKQCQREQVPVSTKFTPQIASVSQILFQILFEKLFELVKRNYIQPVVQVRVTGSGDKQQFFIIALHAAICFFTCIKRVCLVTVYYQHGTLYLIRICHQRECKEWKIGNGLPSRI